MMHFNSIANYTPVSLQFTRLNADEMHFYSFTVIEAQKQRIGYQPIDNLQYLCHVTDQRLIFEPQFAPAIDAERSALQSVSRPVAQTAPDQEEAQEQPSGSANATATLKAVAAQVFQIDYEMIAAFKTVRTLSGSYARIVLRGERGGEGAIVLAVREAGTKQHNCARAFVQLGRDFLNSNGLPQMFEFNPQAVSRFNQEMQASLVPVLVDFWAPGCEPCRMMKPVIEAIAVQFDDRLKVVKINVEENFSVPMHYGIDCFPSLLLFKSGSVAEKISGTVSERILTKVLNKHLAG